MMSTDWTAISIDLEAHPSMIEQLGLYLYRARSVNKDHLVIYSAQLLWALTDGIEIPDSDTAGLMRHIGALPNLDTLAEVLAVVRCTDVSFRGDGLLDPAKYAIFEFGSLAPMPASGAAYVIHGASGSYLPGGPYIPGVPLTAGLALRIDGWKTRLRQVLDYLRAEAFSRG